MSREPKFESSINRNDSIRVGRDDFFRVQILYPFSTKSHVYIINDNYNTLTLTEEAVKPSTDRTRASKTRMMKSSMKFSEVVTALSLSAKELHSKPRLDASFSVNAEEISIRPEASHKPRGSSSWSGDFRSRKATMRQDTSVAGMLRTLWATLNIYKSESCYGFEIKIEVHIQTVN